MVLLKIIGGIQMGGDSEEARAAQQHVSRLMVEAMTITYAYGIKDPRSLLDIDPLQGGDEAGNDPQVWRRAVVRHLEHAQAVIRQLLHCTAVPLCN